MYYHKGGRTAHLYEMVKLIVTWLGRPKLAWNDARSAGEKDWLLASKTPTVERALPLPVMP